MCGIAGHISSQGADARLVQTMCDVIRHRGPDEDGFLREREAVLGMRRLSIIDVAHGHQPAFNESRSVAVVFNGEIYNFMELRSWLAARGHAFDSASDTEVIAHLYEEVGVDLVDHLRGMFAFALWDRERQRLVLARDRAGKKPLYYREEGDDLVFGSELKALMQDARLQRAVDPVALDEYLTFGYVGAPRSILEGVHKVPPASLLVREDGRTTVRPYWRLSYTTKTRETLPEAIAHTRALVREATAIRLVSERPLGAFLSGGIDSSLVVAAMAEQASGPVKTFCIGFEDQAFDERHFARLVADRFSTDHHELVVHPEPSVLEQLPYFYDEPFADSSALPTYYVSELARGQVTVALNGDGGDESFGGYLRYAANAAAARFPSMPALQRPMLGVLDRLRPLRARPVMARRARHAVNLLAGSPEDRYVGMMTYFDPLSKQAMYAKSGPLSPYRDAGGQSVRRAWTDSEAPSLIDRMLDVDVRTYLPGDLLVKVDIATMAHSLEARSPLLDHHLMEYAASLPAEWKVRGRTTKYLLKQAARGWLPDEILDRPKMGFGVPVARWLRGDWRDVAWDLLTDQTARARGWFDPTAVQAVLREHDEGRDWSTRIWALMQLELWCRHWLDRPVAAIQPSPAGATRRRAAG